MTPKKYPQNLHTPKNILFSETPKNIEIAKKVTLAYVCMKISEYPPLVSPRPVTRRGEGGNGYNAIFTLT